MSTMTSVISDPTQPTPLQQSPVPDPDTQDKLANVPDRYDLNDDEVQKFLKGKFDDRYRVGMNLRPRFEREAMQLVLFYAGQQWHIWDNGTNRFRVKNLPAWFPLVTANKFAEKANDLISAILQGGRPAINYVPANDSPGSYATAEISEDIRETLYSEANIDKQGAPETATWVVLNGTGWQIPYWDKDPKYGVGQGEPLFTCQQCGKDYNAAEARAAGMECPECKAGMQTPPPPEPMEPTPDGDMGGQVSPEDMQGEPGQTPAPPTAPVAGPPLLDMGHTGSGQPVGKFCSDTCSFFEMIADNRVRNPQEDKWRMRLQVMYAQDAKRKWGKMAEGVATDKDSSLSQFFLDALAFVASPSAGAPDATAFFAGTGQEKEQRCSVYTLWELPTPEYPEGLRAVRLGKSGKIVECEPLPDKYGAGPRAGQPFLPGVQFGFDRQPGRRWGKTRMADLISLQRFHNLILAMIRLTVARMGNGVWLNPTGSQMDLPTGDPGAIINYTPISVGGSTFAKPERVPAELSGIQGLIVTLKMIEDAMERIAGTVFLQGGDVPPGVVAACMDEETECLSKRGWLRHSDLRDEDEIYTFDPRTGAGEWCRPQRINRYHYNGEVLVGENLHLSVVMTPNHRWCVGSCNENSAKYCTAQRDREKPDRKRYRPRKPKSREKFSFVQAVSLKKHQYIQAAVPLSTLPNRFTWTDAEVRILGWVFTEGSYSKRLRWVTPEHCVEISQSQPENPKECDLIRAALHDANVKFSESPDKRNGVIRFRISGTYARKIVESFPEKIPTFDFLNDLSARQLQLLVDTMLLGDGSEATERNGLSHHSRVFNSTNFQLAERFQMAATLAGYPTSQVKPYYRGEVNHKKPEYSNFAYRVTIKKTDRYKMRTFIPMLERQQFSGTVWCPTTHTGTWIARRAGKVFITGNSALAFLSEKADAAMAPFKRSWAESWAEWEGQGLEILRANASEERIRVIAGRDKKWQVKKFIGAELTGAVQMLVDEKSLIRKSHATERAEDAQLIQLGVINPADPEQNYKILQHFGKTAMKGSESEDAQEAIQEWEEFLESGKIPTILPLVQNSQAHILYHCNAAKTSEFKELPPQGPAPSQQTWLDHIHLHYQDMFARQAAFQPPPTQGQGQGEAGPISPDGQAKLGGKPGGGGTGGQGGTQPRQPEAPRAVEAAAGEPGARRGNQGGLGAGGGEA